MLLEDIQEKAEDNEILFINPLTDDPKKILRKLKKVRLSLTLMML